MALYYATFLYGMWLMCISILLFSFILSGVNGAVLTEIFIVWVIYCVFLYD